LKRGYFDNLNKMTGKILKKSVPADFADKCRSFLRKSARSAGDFIIIV